MIPEHPLVERYLVRLEKALLAASPRERAEVLNDIRGHIADAVAAGSPIEDVLGTLGPADLLARAYAVELLLNPIGNRSPVSAFRRFVALAGLVALTSIPTLIIVTALGATGASFLVSGGTLFVAGLSSGVGVTLPLPLSGVEAHPVLTVATGSAFLLVGAIASWGLYAYLRWMTQILRRRLPATS